MRLDLSISAMVAALGVVGVLLVGCTTQGGTATGTIATYEPSGEGGFTAALEGVVSSRNGCLVIEPDGGGAAVVPVFPSTLLRVDDSGPLWQDAPLNNGDRISLGGGYVDAQTVDVEAGAACVVGEVFIVSQEP
ncbi:hypothetical protein [Microbacterium sp. C7(2022)]|uniref:hypothetical protein n=1 Tax=Microbacterium sp. C7(2022) TaxID=2992759 RepID=UPI00237BC14E|nr:hypothetical protein [Microbacterium sp. C7(2022)]MDE0546221.1 hypothetical protein [Microbacterium sp. C7(2022)]